jgi:rhamnulokinase
MKHCPTLAAVDLGAESCRISLLRFTADKPRITMVRRLANAPRQTESGLFWDLPAICREVEAGLRECAEIAREGIDAIGVTGWAVDYVRLGRDGRPLGLPYCYRDPRNTAAMDAVHAIVPTADLYTRTGIQVQPLNTLYQLYADKLNGSDASAPWVNLPEYVLHWLGAPRAAEYTNATHSGLIDPETKNWNDDLFAALGLDRAAAPEIIAPGTALGFLREDLRRLPAFSDTQLIAPACHDTASAVAGITAADSEAWAYISSGTWSLAGMLLPESVRTAEAGALGFTNLGAAGGGILFHRGLPGMWLLRECLAAWAPQRSWGVAELIAAAERAVTPEGMLDLDDPALASPGNMPACINEQRRRAGLAALPEGSEAAPDFASLIFHSLASRYGRLFRTLHDLTGRDAKSICVVGGGSRNEYLNRLTCAATGLPVRRCAAESTTLGNLAIQWARLEQQSDGVAAASISRRAVQLADALQEAPTARSD